MINAKTLPAFIIGDPVEHSRSPLMHNAAFRFMGINAVYLALPVKHEDLPIVIPGLKKMPLLGMNVTIPHKTAIIPFLDELSDEALTIKAVNTIENQNGKWIGHNTDWYGVFKTLELNKIRASCRTLVIGAGGATNGVVYGLLKYGIDSISVTNRTMAKAEEIARIFPVNLVHYDRYQNQLDQYDLIINTTSIGFNELIPQFHPARFYFDLKYYSGQIDIPNYIDGNLMLLYQGARAFEIWIGQDAPVEVMESALKSMDV